MLNFTPTGWVMPLLFELIVMSIAVLVALRIKAPEARWLACMEQVLWRVARRRALSIVLIGVLGFIASASVSVLVRFPEPRIHDEFSYMLGADTFAHGRLANPTHPMWRYFESFHIIQQPTYVSKYPPAQALVLGLGQAVGGHPMVGVWLGMAAACATIYWMLLAWAPPWLALLGGLLAVLRLATFGYWAQSYWGGAMAALGGALLFGALRRLMHRARARDAALMGAGLVVLANSRPWEGLVVSLPAGIVFVAWLAGRKAPPRWITARGVLAPLLIVLALSGGAMGLYNLHTTGRLSRMPYQVHETTYAAAGGLLFVWQRPKPLPAFKHTALRDYQVAMVQRHVKQLSATGFIRASVLKLSRLWQFFLGIPLTVPLAMLPWMLRDRWTLLALSTCGAIMLVMLATVPWHPHYAAPMTGLAFAIALQGMRHLRLLRWRGRPVGRRIMWAIPLVSILSLGPALVLHLQPDRFPWHLERARLQAKLSNDGGRHLVIVRYGAGHRPAQEWVYNAADIDKAPVVWAREMDSMKALIEYFRDRRVWLLEVDVDGASPAVIRPYSPQATRG